jgi:hypothetical protein
MANLASSPTAGHIQVLAPLTFSPTDTSFIPTAIIAKELGPGPKLVYSRLLACAANNGSATNHQLAADPAVSPRSIRNYITALKAAGLVQVELHPGKPRSFTLAATN